MWRNVIPLVFLAALRTVASLDPTYSSALGYETCEATSVATPKTIAEVQNVVKDARKANLKVKVVGNRLSATDIFCTDGIAVDMSNIQQVDVDGENGLVTVGSGAAFERLYSELAQVGYSILHPGGKYSGVSVGGALNTATHSSSLVHPSTIADQVISMTLVNGLGDVVTATGALLDATAVGIGALGVVVDVTLKIYPIFKIRMENAVHKESFLVNGDAVEMARGKDYFALNWFPSTDSVTSSSGTYIPDVSTPGNDVANYAFPKNPGSMAFSRRVEQAQAKGDNKFFCNAEKMNVESWVTGAVGVKTFVNETGDFKNPAVGMMTDLLTQYCPRDGGCGWEGKDAFLSHEIEIAIDLDLLPAAIKRIKAVVRSRRYCLITLNGIGIRFGRQSTRHLSPASGSEVAWFEIVTPLRQDYTLAFYKMDVYAELAQVLYLEFGGRIHWGKGGNSMFVKPFNHPSILYPRWDDFLSAKQELDPEGVFENEFIRRLLGTSRIKKTEFCAVYDQCVCDKNLHCPKTHKCDTKGYKKSGIGFCTPRKMSRKMSRKRKG